MILLVRYILNDLLIKVRFIFFLMVTNYISEVTVLTHL